MPKYFILTNHLEIEPVGEFPNFSEAWEYIDYEMSKPFVWLIKEENLRKLVIEIEDKLC